MADLAGARQAIADALNTVGDFNVSSRMQKFPKALDGWVRVDRIEPSSFGTCAVTFQAIVLLSADEYVAEGLLESYGVALVNAVTQAVPFADFALESVVAPVGEANSPFYALILTLSTEVS